MPPTGAVVSQGDGPQGPSWNETQTAETIERQYGRLAEAKQREEALQAEVTELRKQNTDLTREYALMSARLTRAERIIDRIID